MCVCVGRGGADGYGEGEDPMLEPSLDSLGADDHRFFLYICVDILWALMIIGFCSGEIKSCFGKIKSTQIICVDNHIFFYLCDHFFVHL